MKEKFSQYFYRMNKKDLGVFAILVILSIVVEIYRSFVFNELSDIENMIASEKSKQISYNLFEKKNLSLVHKKIFKIKTMEELKDYVNSSAKNCNVIVKNIKYTNEKLISIKMNISSPNDVNIMNFLKKLHKKLLISVKNIFIGKFVSGVTANIEIITIVEKF